ncbi:MAG: restriction endonuclease [Spirochaetales bacterium]|nr:restriction endonuclease [Candidatus Physcosoma equi]
MTHRDIVYSFERMVSEIKPIFSGIFGEKKRSEIDYQAIDDNERMAISSLLSSNHSAKLKDLMLKNGLDYNIHFVDSISDKSVEVENQLKTTVVALDNPWSFGIDDQIKEKDKKYIDIFIEKVIAVAKHNRQIVIDEVEEEAASIKSPIKEKEFDSDYEGPYLFIEISPKKDFSWRSKETTWDKVFLPANKETVSIRHCLTNECAEVKGKESSTQTQEVLDKAVCRLNSQYYNQELEKQTNAIENCLSKVCSIENLSEESFEYTYGLLSGYDALALAEKQRQIDGYRKYCEGFTTRILEDVDTKNEYLQGIRNNNIFVQSYYEILQRENGRIRRANKFVDDLEKNKHDNQCGRNRAIEAFSQYKDDKKYLSCFMKQLIGYSQYGIGFKKEVEVAFEDNGCLVIEYRLPNKNDLQNIKGCKYNSTLKKIEYQTITDKKLLDYWEKLVYSIALRTVKEVFVNDIHGIVREVVFNGWCNRINGATGKEQSVCIMSLSCGKEEIQNINLEAVDPKQCFRALQGVSCAKIIDLIPIQPIMAISHNDSRFIEAIDVAEGIDKDTNLAAIEWQDFEHLIREVFAKEFSSEGSEVRITQSSRDGGVDAIAFDNDPIRGGKIVIQAKRYTNTVGVSAVRDLYGTVLNEGAMKGILVTASSFGSDSYDFAKGKPLTLLSGGNLLALMEKHGYHARIDLEEAKLMQLEK